MLVLDQVKRSDARLQWIGWGVLAGMIILLAGLWYLQVVSRHKYEDSLRLQAFRNVRLAPARGRILDRHEQPLADNQPRYVVNVYLEELRDKFVYEYTNTVRPDFSKVNGRTPTLAERGPLQEVARYRAVSNIVWQVSASILPQPLILDARAFARHYETRRAIPMPVITDLTPEQVGLFVEKSSNLRGVELEVESLRNYPHGKLAAHSIGYVQREREDSFQEDEEEIAFRYRMPDFTGVSGIEGTWNKELRGKAGAKAIQVNNIGYRYKDEIYLPPVPGQNVRLTLDLQIQKAAEKALLQSGPDTRGAVVVLDPRNGDILALASSPTYDLNMFVRGREYPQAEWDRLQDETLLPQYNRALQGMYHPGSIFKIIVGLAAFEAGVISPEEEIYNPGFFKIGRRKIDDTAPAGRSYDFKDAFKYSANTYFIEVGLRAGVDQILKMGHRFGLGTATGVMPSRFERGGFFPKVGDGLKEDGGPWTDGDTGNLSIGQGEVTVTPVQMALMTAAVANGGKVLRPRLVAGLTDQTTRQVAQHFPNGVVNREVGVRPQFLEWVRRAMLADVEEAGGTGQEAAVPGMRICGKTGTAQVRKGRTMDHVTWFVSFAPFEAPQYVVVVMVESGVSGGGTCAPKAREIYKTIQKLEQERAATPPQNSFTMR